MEIDTATLRIIKNGLEESSPFIIIEFLVLISIMVNMVRAYSWLEYSSAYLFGRIAQLVRARH